MDVVPIFDEYLQTVIYLEETKVYVINMQACNTKNFGLFDTFNDPGDQLTRLQSILESARTQNE